MIKEVKEYNLSENGNVKGYKWYKENLDNYKGILIISHGMAEHIERYDAFATFLANNGYIVYGHNQRGHKDTIKSKDDYGYMSDYDNFNILVNDINEINKLIKEEYPELPIYLFGHSMGSFVSQRYIELYGTTVNGCILCGSSLNPSALISAGSMVAKIICKFKGRRYRSKLLDNLSFGSYNKVFKPNRTPYDWLNRDNDEVDKYIADEYCGGIFTAAYFKDFLSGLKTEARDYQLIPKSLPILIISGEKDPVGGCSKNVTSLYNTLKKQNIKDITFKLYDDARHEILLEQCKDEVMNDCLNWLNNHEKLS